MGASAMNPTDLVQNTRRSPAAVAGPDSGVLEKDGIGVELTDDRLAAADGDEACAGVLEPTGTRLRFVAMPRLAQVKREVESGAIPIYKGTAGDRASDPRLRQPCGQVPRHQRSRVRNAVERQRQSTDGRQTERKRHDGDIRRHENGDRRPCNADKSDR